MSRRLDKIIIRGLLVRGVIGVDTHERVVRQDILVDLVLHTDVRRAGATDNLDDTVSYRKICEQVRERVVTGADYLVEKLATDIARLILGNHGPVQTVQVRVEKPGVLRHVQSVGVEIVRSRDDFRNEFVST